MDWKEELVEFYRKDVAFLRDDTDEFETITPDQLVSAPARPVIKVPKVSPLAVSAIAVAVVGTLAGMGLLFVGLVKSAEPESVALESTCAGEPIADRTTPDGVVVAFQHSYFSQDVAGVQAVLAEQSALSHVKWADVLPEPGNVACVNILGQSVSNVRAQTVVTNPSSDQVIAYTQQFSMELGSNGPRILTITDIDPEGGQ